MLIATALIDDPVAAGLGITFAGSILGALTIASRSQLRSAKAAWKREALERAVNTYVDGEGHSTIYEAVQPLSLSLAGVARSAVPAQLHKRTELRIPLVESLPDEARGRLHTAAAAILSEYGGFARQAWLQRIPLDTYLQSQHLKVIRLVTLAEAVFVADCVGETRTLAPDLNDRVAWALAVRDLASARHKASSWQRDAVTFAGPEAGSILDPTGRIEGGIFRARHLTGRFLLRRRHHRRAAKRFIQSVAESRANIESRQTAVSAGAAS